MTWIQAILDFLRQFWPFVVIYSFQRGVRFWCGRDVATLKAGLHFVVPFFGHIEAVAVVPDLIRLGNQNLTTQDGKPVLVAANIAYRVADARQAYCNVQEFTVSLADLARVYLAQSIREYTFAELLESQDALEESCAEYINAAAEEWGVVVERVGLADFTPTRSYAVANV